MNPMGWDRELELSPFEDGRYQAERVCNRPVDALLSRLENARYSRARLMTRLFHRAKRRYLDGFIERIEEEIRHRQESP